LAAFGACCVWPVSASLNSFGPWVITGGAPGTFVEKRLESVGAQLAGQCPDYTPQFQFHFPGAPPRATLRDGSPRAILEGSLGGPPRSVICPWPQPALAIRNHQTPRVPAFARENVDYSRRSKKHARNTQKTGATMAGVSSPLPGCGAWLDANLVPSGCGGYCRLNEEPFSRRAPHDFFCQA
jgi:hypothetical protein